MLRPMLRTPRPLAAVLSALSLGLLVLLPRPAAALAPLGAPLSPSDCASCYKDFPSVAGTASGRFLAVWQTADRLPPAHNASASASSRVDAGAADFPRSPAIAADRAGNFAVVWEGERRIVGRRFAFSGAAYGAEMAIAPIAAGVPAHPAISAVGTAGGFVALWRDGAAGLAGRRLNP